MFCKLVFDVPLDRDFDYIVPSELADKVIPGVRVTAPFGRVLACGLVTSVSEISTAPAHITLKPITAVLDDKPLFGSDLFPLVRFIKAHWGGPVGQIFFALIPPQPYFKLTSLSGEFRIPSAQPSYTWSVSQQEALQTLRTADPYTYQSFLFQGPHSSGKTETVLAFSRDVLAQHGQVLLTVPDLVAARQFIKQVQERFGEENVYSWHSRTLLSHKKQAFAAICSGRPCVVVAARSGVLLPFKNLRFAAMFDEEDDNYKQEENKPYYHARDVLFFRAKVHGTPLVFVSETPGMEMLKALQEKQVTSVRFTSAVVAQQKPLVKITEKKSDKSRYFSSFLLERLAENIAQHRTSLLLLNRRGYTGTYYCLNCGAYAKCKKCGAILSHEKSDEGTERLHCKKCGSVETLEQECPKCHNLIFKSRGGGTQKIMTELAKLFPSAKLLRLDSDTLKTKAGQGFEAISALQNGKADIIVGTRLAAGSLRGAQVSLAAVLDGELELDGPDFRASEKFGQLLFHLRNYLAGQPDGTLVIQTADAANYDYDSLKDGNYKLAAQNELALRESFGYPPYTCLIRATLKAKDSALLQTETRRLKQVGNECCEEILGPVWCTKKTDKLLKQYLLFKTRTEHYLDLVARLDSFVPAKKVSLQVWADPYNFY